MWSAITLVAGVPAIAQNTATDHQRLGREVLKELIETNTTLSSGSVTAAAERMAARLVSAGFPQADVQVVGEPRRNATWSRATAATARASRFSSSRTWTWSRRGAKTGRSIRSC